MATDTRTQHTHWGIGAEMLTPAGAVEINSDEGDVIGFVFPQYAEKVAAAPDLLSVCEQVLGLHEDFNGMVEARMDNESIVATLDERMDALAADIEAAIAKARGQ